MNLYKELSSKRKQGQIDGEIPEWYTTAGLQLFSEKYAYKNSTVRQRFETIAKTLAKYIETTDKYKNAKNEFFNLLWKGWLSPSTPVLANVGTDRGLCCSCSGGTVDDSVEGFYDARKEAALLTKYGFGTSAYLGDIRPRGSDISSGGKASGILPVLKGFIQDSKDVSQGNVRRGSWAGYIEITHNDFDEIADFILNESDNCNVGWLITDEFINELNEQNTEYLRRYQKTLKIKMVTGRGYFCFIDKINRHRPDCYKDKDLKVKASNLCCEVNLFSDSEHSFSCVLSSMNISKYDEWKDTDAVYWSTIFLDCVAEDLIQNGKHIKGLEKVIRFTEKGRALGLGQCGFHTYLQSKMIPFDSLEASFINREVAKHIWDESLEASQEMAELLGEPEWCEGYGIRNTHRISIAPTKSTASLVGGISECISPDPAMAYVQSSAAGEIERINPILVNLMKEKGIFNKKTISDIKENSGSVQDVIWLTDDEKQVFKTAFEINQEVILRLASQRAQYIDQWQSLNLFFSANENEEHISKIHRMAFEDENIRGLYYIYSQKGIQASKDECSACM